MEKNICSSKGISMVEVVIALVVITIISIATLSVVFMSVKVEAKAAVTMEVRNAAENAVECFRFADGDKTEFIKCLDKSVGIEEDEKAENNELGFQTLDGVHYTLDKGGYSIEITVHEETQIKQDEKGQNVDIQIMITFDFAATYDSNNDVIYSFTFANGGEQE